MAREPRHCDEYIDDIEAPAVLRAYLARVRGPAHGALSKDPYPRLFADYRGERVHVTVASRFGDLGITSVLEAETGCSARVAVNELSNFSDVP
jgi:hypothetical protein